MKFKLLFSKDLLLKYEICLWLFSCSYGNIIISFSRSNILLFIIYQAIGLIKLHQLSSFVVAFVSVSISSIIWRITMSKLISNFVSDESGAGAIEYALVILLAVAVVVAITPVLKGQITSFLTSYAGKLTASSNNIS